MRKNRFKQQHINFSSLGVNSVEELSISASAAFTVNSSQVFRDDVDIAPVLLSNGIQYMPWGADNQLPFHILDMIERDETLSTCQMFNAEICYGNGLQYNVDDCTAEVRSSVDGKFLNSLLSVENDLYVAFLFDLKRGFA